jgi:hypothetical protein
LAADEIDHRRRAAAIRHVDEIRARRLLKQLHGEVLAGIDAG